MGCEWAVNGLLPIVHPSLTPRSHPQAAPANSPQAAPANAPPSGHETIVDSLRKYMDEHGVSQAAFG